MGRLKDVSIDKKVTLLKIKYDFGDFEATQERKKPKTTETSIYNMMVSNEDQKTKKLKHSTLYGRVTSVSPVTRVCILLFLEFVC